MVACAPWGAAGEFAASRHGALTRSQAAERGISSRVVSRLLRDGVLDEPSPGVLVVRGTPPTWHQRVRRDIGLQRCWCRGLSICRRPRRLRRLWARSAGAASTERPTYLPQDVIHHRGPMGPEHANDFTQVQGIRCTGIARTLCDLGSVDPRDQVKAAFESAWRRGVSLVWMRETAERLHRPGQRGNGRADVIARRGRDPRDSYRVCARDVPRELPRWDTGTRASIHDLRRKSSLRSSRRLRNSRVQDCHRSHSRKYHFGPERGRRRRSGGDGSGRRMDRPLCHQAPSSQSIRVAFLVAGSHRSQACCLARRSVVAPHEDGAVEQHFGNVSAECPEPSSGPLPDRFVSPLGQGLGVLLERGDVKVAVIAHRAVQVA